MHQEPEPFYFEGSEPEPPKIGRLRNSGNKKHFEHIKNTLY